MTDRRPIARPTSAEDMAAALAFVQLAFGSKPISAAKRAELVATSQRGSFLAELRAGFTFSRKDTPKP